MAIFRDNDSENYEFVTSVVTSDSYEVPRSVEMPLIGAKLRTPNMSDVVDRKWLLEMLDRSIKNSTATLLVGRAGSGKTALAANFARGRSDHSWYSIDAIDADWNAFQRYFRAALTAESKDSRGKRAINEIAFSSQPVELFADITAALELDEREWPSLIVLDNVHHLFDCCWFEEFFAFLIASLPHTSHVILLSRSKPPTPVWRLRSKQVLNVIDEESLAFSPTEAVELFAKNGLNRDVAVKAQAQTFGRPADMIAFIESAAVTARESQRIA
ncbi:MAG: AAA family ATPase [Pyrinomonadaceae bacterium]